jgi:hypothetical protein
MNSAEIFHQLDVALNRGEITQGEIATWLGLDAGVVSTTGHVHLLRDGVPRLVFAWCAATSACRPLTTRLTCRLCKRLAS